MPLNAQFLPVGSIVEYNIGTTDKPEWSATTLDAVDLQWLDGDPIEFNIAHRPIPLTPEILTEWCEFEKDGDDYILDINSALFVSYNDDDFVHLKSNNLETIASIQYLHQLQHLYSALTQQVLTVKIK